MMKKLKDSDWQGNFGYWQKGFISDNLMMIGYFAWQGFLQQGRGVLLCDVDPLAIAPSSLAVTPFHSRFIALQDLSIVMSALPSDQELVTVLLQAVTSYIPETEILLVLKMEQHLEINLFQNLKIFPPDCYTQVSRRWEEFQPCLESQIK
jgi:hypothetical protein